ncbi:MAG TPA: Coenzyme F420 hydrogenase/dehydrogenase, beta subunit C-terminal domain [Candidatus Hydrogenedentes bacterium]|nr:Coenzyme F420 hydrogenase/dehydrogenase, beta subunit C-terminal domain [Candidatus Hydrogenedentota bacterium]
MNEDPSGAADALALGEMYCGYANDAEVRAHASSGGIVSAILLDELEAGAIDAALVSWIASENGQIKAVSGLVENRGGVLAEAGSAYVYTPVIDAVRDLENTNRRVAVVALPCQARGIRKLTEKRPNLRRNVVLVIGLFCRGAVGPEFYDDLFRKKGIDPGEVERVKVARGHVGGEVRVVLRDGRIVPLSFFGMNAYRTSGVHAHSGCLHCTEHLAEDADISVGDIFTPEYERREIKHSCFIPRTEAGRAIMQRLAESGRIAFEFFGTQRYRQTFRKIEAFSNALDARALAAKLTGVRLPPHPIRFCHPLHVLSWMIFFTFFRLSRTSWGRRMLYALPPITVKSAAILVKGLSKT